ncbi:MAG: 2'-5' RNA ligase family protein [Acidobacteria bacterium]|nr:2'-5' RNA ligase family protein [Acidobacteriota bacterium]
MCPPNHFALVVYIPDLLGRFLDDLRLSLAPDCDPRAHISVLPPRPLAAPWREIAAGLADMAAEVAPFEIEATRIRVFAPTDVVYIDVGAGAGQLHRLHDAMGNGALAFSEPFSYHAHITVAQEIGAQRVAEVCRTAERAWRAYPGPRRFRAEKLMFVQLNPEGRWVDLAELALMAAPVASR